MLKSVHEKRQSFSAAAKKSGQLHLPSVSSESPGNSCCYHGCSSSLEVVSHERFLQQLEGMSSSSSTSCRTTELTAGEHCDCRRPDFQFPLSHRAFRSSRGKRNSPIVICLHENIRNCGRRVAKASSMTRRTLSESSAATMADVSVQTQISMPEQLPLSAPLSAPPTGDKSSKNLNAFLSAIEKAQSKCDRPLNMVQNEKANINSNHTRSVPDLPNSMSSDGILLNNSLFQPAESGPKDSINCRKNVDIIHNDLQCCSSVPAQENTVSDELTEVDSSSGLTSSTESDDEPTVGFVNGETFEVAPQHCHKCLAAHYAYTHYYALGSKYFKIEVLDDVDSKTQGEGGIDSSSWHTTSQQWNPFRYHRHIDVVSLDLTGSDVTFTVEQLPQAATSSSNSKTADCNSPSSSSSSSSPEFIHNFYCTMFGFVPCMPGCCFVPAYYFTFPIWSVSKSSVSCLSAADERFSSGAHQSLNGNNQHSEPHCIFRPSLPAAPQRPWLNLGEPERQKPAAIFSVMCYNILCDKYATRQLYGYCPSWALNWHHRKQYIIQEIHQYNADVICLQEVETEQFYQFFLPQLQAEGYDGIFSPKSRARTMTEAERQHVDGCAIFFRHTKFQLISEHLVEFNQLAIETAKGSHDMINRVMTKDNIGLAALLETKPDIWENAVGSFDSRQLLLVATCHIHWDPDYSDVKLIQTMMLMNELKNIVEEAKTSTAGADVSGPEKAVPLLLCGDFNSLPDSGVVEFLNEGQLRSNHKDFKDIGYEDTLHKLSVSDSRSTYSHAFQLAQAYSPDIMPYTNYTSDFKGIIDYIFHSRDRMRPLGLLGSFDVGWFADNRIVGCPNTLIPSDHLPLLVEFELNTGAIG